MSLPNPPPSLKFIQSFIVRAREMEKNDPVISYYCKYYAIEEALASKVHQTDAAAAEYVTELLDIIEKEKDRLKNQDTVNDEVVAQAYVEKFATRIFAHADKDIINKTASKLTAMNFLAAATFLEILKLFGEPDKELLGQIKYCKFHATRILRTIAAGQDPNDYEELAVEAAEPATDLNLPTQNLSLNGTPSSPPAPSSPPPSFTSAPSLALQHTPSAPLASFSPPLAADSPSSRSAPLAVNHEQHRQVSKIEVQQIVDDAERISTVKKHARFAISALDYDDTDTAIKELKTALALLGV
ncbi:Vta1 like-domain-containing protein [Lipomyces arxii]|uniref:Vta1 like-domain-containing protein n=1 Tax=Lipomyces arxii TaxID=56418 RepID=UPI0034CE8D38